jgi:hypothetical protein
MKLSFTPNEIVAQQIVARLCRRPPYGQAWRDYAVKEIARALTTATVQRTKEAAASDQHRSKGVADAAATG